MMLSAVSCSGTWLTNVTPVARGDRSSNNGGGCGVLVQAARSSSSQRVPTCLIAPAESGSLARPRERGPDGGSSSRRDRKSTRLNSSHSQISYAVFCLKKKKKSHSHILITVSLLKFLPRSDCIPP